MAKIGKGELDWLERCEQALKKHMGQEGDGKKKKKKKKSKKKGFQILVDKDGKRYFLVGKKKIYIGDLDELKAKQMYLLLLKEAKGEQGKAQRGKWGDDPLLRRDYVKAPHRSTKKRAPKMSDYDKGTAIEPNVVPKLTAQEQWLLTQGKKSKNYDDVDRAKGHNLIRDINNPDLDEVLELIDKFNTDPDKFYYRYIMPDPERFKSTYPQIWRSWLQHNTLEMEAQAEMRDEEEKKKKEEEEKKAERSADGVEPPSPTSTASFRYPTPPDSPAGDHKDHKHSESERKSPLWDDGHIGLFGLENRPPSPPPVAQTTILIPHPSATAFDQSVERIKALKTAHEEMARMKALLEGHQHASGKGDQGGGLYDDQIEKVMSKYKNFLGVISCDEIPKLVKKVKEHKKVGFIINTDPSYKGGQHWQAIYIDPVDSKSVEFYDSFGRKIPPKLMADLKKLVDKVEPHQMLKFKENRVIQQSDKSDDCGYFAMRYLLERFRGKSFSEATGFDDNLKIHAVRKNEKEIERMKKAPPFSYL